MCSRAGSKPILVDRDAYLLELCRYVELNPVRAGMAAHPGQWPWPSYRAHTGQQQAPAWLAGLHRFMSVREMKTARDHRAAALGYADWVAAAVPDTRLWDTGLRQQMYLGDDVFVQRMQALASQAQVADRNIPKAQRRASMMSMADWLKAAGSVDEALYRGHREGGLTLTHMAAELGRTVSWASKAVARYERSRRP